LITPPALDDFGEFGKKLNSALDAADVACLQLRLKETNDDTIRRACDILRPITQAHDVALLMNDRPDLAIETGCDGVHVGQDDASYQEAREIVGDDAIVGVTCHDSFHLAMEAAENGADYVAFGAFFATTTKQAKSVANPEILRTWQSATIVPSVAIGGIQVENCADLVSAGTDFISVASGIWDYPAGPAQAVKDFNSVFSNSPRNSS
jgi:thiamine-phosphate pyrophosphorylase